MKLLASLCNKAKYEGLERPDAFLVEIDTASGEVRPISFDLEGLRGIRGMTGLVRHGDCFRALLQGSPNRIVELSPDYHPSQVWTLTRVRAGHSLIMDGEAMLVASSGTDSIMRVEPDGTETVYWSDNEGGEDSVHVNSLMWHEGELLATAFGKRKGLMLSSAHTGYVMEVSSGERLDTSTHPHSLASHEGRLYFCESKPKNVAVVGGERLHVGVGYIRGLAFAGEQLFVGVSSGRVRSMSTGQHVDISNDPALAKATCGVLSYRADSEDLASSDRQTWYAVAPFGREIYDIVVLD